LTPLLDRTHTPRGALRAITLDRHHTNKRWLASKTICEDLSPEKSQKEIAKGKLLSKITKKRRQSEERRSVTNKAIFGCKPRPKKRSMRQLLTNITQFEKSFLIRNFILLKYVQKDIWYF